MDPGKATQYNKEFTWYLPLWNILFNVGFMYTDIKNLVVIGMSNTSQYYQFAYAIGDFLMRFVYSRYVPKPYVYI